MTQTETTPKYILVADDEAHIGRIIKIKMEQGPCVWQKSYTAWAMCVRGTWFR